LATSSAQAGKSGIEIMRQTRHHSEAMVCVCQLGVAHL
jgi:hypothetical protein